MDRQAPLRAQLPDTLREAECPQLGTPYRRQWRARQAGRGAKPYGIEIDPGMRKDEKFPTPILTPSTKAALGKHDEPISARGLVARGALTQKQWDELARRSLELFAAGQEWAKK